MGSEWGKHYERFIFLNGNTSNQSLVCTNETDRFSMSNVKAKLKYPIGLLSVPEINLASYESSNYFNSRQFFWFGSPDIISCYYAIVRVKYYDYLDYSNVNEVRAARSSVSLKPEIEYASGDGSFTNPFVIE